jgi:hypothetical protein
VCRVDTQIDSQDDAENRRADDEKLLHGALPLRIGSK